MDEPFASDNAMRKAARERGLRVGKERDTLLAPGRWTVKHAITHERLLAGSRGQIAAFVAGYNPGEERLAVLGLIPRVLALAPIIDWPQVREDDYWFEYVWEDLESVAERLRDFEAGATWGLAPKPPPGRSDGERLLGWDGGTRELMSVRDGLSHLWLPDLSPLHATGDEGERRRALAEAGRLKAIVDYLLERRASWPEIEAERRAIMLEAEAIASMRSNHGRHGGEAELFRLAKADEREARLVERRARLDQRLGIERERRYWRPLVNEARAAIGRLNSEIVEGDHIEHLPEVRDELARLVKLIEKTSLLAFDGELRERTRKLRQSGKRERIEDAP